MNKQDQRLRAIWEVTADYYRKVRMGTVIAIISSIPLTIKAIAIYNDHSIPTERFFDQVAGLIVLGLLGLSMWVTYSLIKIEEIRKIARELR